MKKPQHLLVFRFSSLGDVAMTVPVLKLLLQQNPGLKVTMVSSRFMQPLFAGIDRLQFYAADLKGKHKGVKGLYRLYRELKKSFTIDAIADLHDVLRTKILRSFFIFSGIPIAVIDKGRREKKELTRRENKILKPLKTTFERYAEVFTSLQLPITLNTSKTVKKTTVQPQEIIELAEQGYKLIGLAPFAQYAEKTYPPEKMQEVIRLLLEDGKIKIFLFGGKNEVSVFDEWEKEFEGVKSLAGKMNFEKELEWISGLDLMISMDSANMHLASLYGVPVVSIWGATHPYAGFYGWGQKENNAIQVELYCRPCSVFGNKPGYRGDLLCMTSISPLTVYNKVMENLSSANAG